MSRGIRRQAPALIVASVALVAALGGTVYAAEKINGHAIKVKSLPGNRLAIGSVPANRLKPGTIPSLQLAPGSIQGDRLAPGSIQGDRLAPGSVTGVQVDVSTLGPVPSAVHADRAETAKEAETAQTALDAVNAENATNAENAKTINGFEAGCLPGTRLFAGACWQTATNSGVATLPAAAESCASQGGELPSAFSLAAFSQQPGITVAAEGEWSNTLATYTGVNSYSVVTVSSTGAIGSALSTNTKKYRCVIPLVG
jgi:hypothetical protein